MIRGISGNLLPLHFVALDLLKGFVAEYAPKLFAALNRLHATRQAKAAERLAKQPGLFDTGSDTPLSSAELATTRSAC